METPLEWAHTLQKHGMKEVSRVPLVAMDVGFKNRRGTQLTDDWSAALVMDWWNARIFPEAHALKSHDAFVVSRRGGAVRLVHVAFPAGYFAAVVEAHMHRNDPSDHFPALTARMDRSRWYRIYESEASLTDDLEGWAEVLDDRRAFVSLLLGLYQYILDGESSVPGMEELLGKPKAD